MSGLVVETAQQRDLPRLFEISSIVHRTNYTELISDEHKAEFSQHYQITNERRDHFVDFVVEKMQSPSYHLFKVTNSDGIIAGYASVEEADVTEVRAVFVLPEFQGQGIGSMLMQTIVQKFGNQALELFVIEGNTAAISLYEKYGFKNQGDSGKSFFGSVLLCMKR